MSVQQVEQIQREVDAGIRFFDERWSRWSGRVVVFMGPTGAGKTTLLHVIAQSVLYGSFNGERGVKEIDVGNHPGENRLPEAVIGHGKNAQTVVPNKLTTELRGEEVTFADCPGLYDTGGAVAQIRNAVLIQKLFERAIAIKVVFVVKQSDISERAVQVINLVRGIRDLFVGRIRDVIPCMSLVVSAGDPRFTVEHAQRNLASMSADVPALAEYEGLLSQLKKRVVVFPSFVGDDRVLDMGSVKHAVENNLNACEWAHGVAVTACVPPDAEMALRNTHRYLSEFISAEMRAYLGRFRSCIEDFIRPCLNGATLSDAQRGTIKQQLENSLSRTEEILSGVAYQGTWCERDVEHVINACLAIATACGQDLSQGGIAELLQRLPSLLYLERFVPQAAGDSLRMMQALIREVADCRPRMQMALMEIDVLDARAKEIRMAEVLAQAAATQEALQQGLRTMEENLQALKREKGQIESQLQAAREGGGCGGCVIA